MAITIAKPAAFAIDGDRMWVLSSIGEISRIDPATNTTSAPTMVAPTWGWGGFGANAAGLWLGDFDANLVHRIDPESLAVVAKIPVMSNPDGTAVTVDAVWVAQHRGGSVTRIDPVTNEAVVIVFGRGAPSGPHDVGIGAGSVWVSAGDTASGGGLGGAVVRIDPATNEVLATIKIPGNASACGGFAISDEAVWMNSCANTNFLVRIDPSTNQVVTTIDLGALGGLPILVDGFPWVLVNKTDTGSDPSRLVRINPATNLVDRVVSLGETFKSERLLQAFGSVWATDWTHDQVLRYPLSLFES